MRLKVCYFKLKTRYMNSLTLQTAFSFTRNLAQEESFDVLNVLIHILARFIVAVLPTYAAGREKQFFLSHEQKNHSTL